MPVALGLQMRKQSPDTIMSSEPEEEPVSVLQRFEKRLEGLVEGAFAKVFKGVVHPVEILNAMQREAEAHKAILAGGRTLVPNRYVIDLSPYDHSRLAPYAAALAPELMPMMSGLASGLRSIVWNVTPPRPKQIPATTASTVRGIRSVPTVKDAPGTSSPRITRITSDGG